MRFLKMIGQRSVHISLLFILTGCFLVLSGQTFSEDIQSVQSEYPVTISVLQNAYQNEEEAVLAYHSYARKALSEDYPNISYLFTTFAASESVHAQNFRRLLTSLGVGIEKLPVQKIIVSSTKDNLRHAADRELKDIDTRYPRFIRQIRPENNREILRVFEYTLESKKQHRDDIQQIRSGTGILFGVLAGMIESKTKLYFVCRICGALADTPPKDACPICHTPAPTYTEVKRTGL
jgi:rubrerythrin